MGKDWSKYLAQVNMSKKNDKNSLEELVIDYLKKNKNFFIKYPELINQVDTLRNFLENGLRKH